MPATITGTPAFVPNGGAVTVPADAQGVFVAYSYYADTASSCATSVTLSDNGTLTELEDLGWAASFQPAVGCSAGPISSTGSKTLTINYTVAGVEGPVAFIVFVKDIDNTSIATWIRDSAVDQADGTGAVAATVNSTTNDLVVAFEQKYLSIPSAPSGWTSQGTGSNNSETCRLTTADSPGGTTTTYTATAPEYGSLIVASIIGTGGGGGGDTLWAQACL